MSGFDNKELIEAAAAFRAALTAVLATEESVPSALATLRRVATMVLSGVEADIRNKQWHDATLTKTPGLSYPAD